MKTSILFVSLFTLAISKILKPIIELPSLGKIQGRRSKSSRGRPYYSFEGVPYAAPPARFSNPQEVQPWQDILQADSRHACLQLKPYRGIDGEEDCLYLNIYTPTLNKNAKLDVIVFIHGGAFTFSSGAFYRPDFLLNENVVYISINYRLGVLGFMSTESDLLPGNNGIRDQIMALKWIQKYITNFGGNPASVTVSGTSAGGSSVTIHMLTPKSKGLIHKAIPRSGVVTNPWSLTEAHLEKSKKLGAIFGCEVDDEEKLVECLRNTPGDQLVNSTQNLYFFPYGDQNPFGVIVDTWASDPIFPEHPYFMMKSGNIANDVPVMISYVSGEGLYPASDYYPDEILEIIDREWNKWIPYILLYEYTVEPDLQDEVSEKIRKFYLGDQKLTKETYKGLIAAVGDRYFNYEIHKAVKLLLHSLKSPIYFNYFDYEGLDSVYRDIPYEYREGVGHYSDVSYVFQTTMEDTNSTCEDRRVVRNMVKMFKNFAKYGDPKIPGWAPVSKNQEGSEVNGLFVGPSDKLSTGTKMLASWELWESLPIMENEKFYS